MSNLIAQLETEQLRNDIPDFRVGDTIIVQVKVKEGNRQRLQAFEGIVIAKRNRGLNSGFTVRKISYGEGVERVFQTHSSIIESISIVRRGDVRKAKLYYLRDRAGRSARIKEKLNFKGTKKEITSTEKNAKVVTQQIEDVTETKPTEVKTEQQNLPQDNTEA